MFTISSQLSDQLSGQMFNSIMQPMIHLLSTGIIIIGIGLFVLSMIKGLSSVLSGEGSPAEIFVNMIPPLFLVPISLALLSFFGNSFGVADKQLLSPTHPSNPPVYFPWRALGITFGITIIIFLACLIGWHFSKNWRNKRALEKRHQKVMKEIWNLRSRIASGEFDKQGLDILNSLTVIEDSIITFKVYKAEATRKEQIEFIKDIKPMINDIALKFGNVWKDTAIENALKNITISS